MRRLVRDCLPQIQIRQLPALCSLLTATLPWLVSASRFRLARCCSGTLPTPTVLREGSGTSGSARRAARRTGQREPGEDFRGQVGIGDEGEDLHLAAALGATKDLQASSSSQELGPAPVALARPGMRVEVDRLAFGVKLPEPAAVAVNADSTPIGAQAVRPSPNQRKWSEPEGWTPSESGPSSESGR